MSANASIEKRKFMIKTTVQSILHTLVWSVITGVIYTAAFTVFAKVVFRHQAEGSLVERDGKIIGSRVDGATIHGDELFLAAAVGVRLRNRTDRNRCIERQ